MTWMSSSVTRTVKGILIATAAAYGVQVVLHALGAGRGLLSWFALSRGGLAAGRVWQLGTYLFLHADPWHLLVNLLVLYLFGPEMERVLGRVAFATMYVAAGVTGGLAFVLWQSAAPCVGASGAVFGVMAAFAFFFPRRPIALVLPPVVLPAWAVVAIFAVLDLAALAHRSSGVANLAHLAGAGVGLLWGWMYRRPVPPDFAGAFRRWKSRRAGRASAGPDRDEVDRILDKIGAEGFSSLNRRERAALERAHRTRRPR